MKKLSEYQAVRLAHPMKPDGDWNKAQWQEANAALITNYMGTVPKFRPVASSKVMYDKESLYVIFNVHDRFIRCITKEINGPVWEDSCVEFFFAPEITKPERYFNLEINCGGTPLMHFNKIAGKETTILDPADIKMIEIAHSLPVTTDPEITDPVNWTIEYRIPLALLEKYSQVTRPEPGIEWKANFYKIAENNSNPHYMTWSVVKNEVPNFHLPQFFGVLKF